MFAPFRTSAALGAPTPRWWFPTVRPYQRTLPTVSWSGSALGGCSQSLPPSSSQPLDRPPSASRCAASQSRRGTVSSSVNATRHRSPPPAHGSGPRRRPGLETVTAFTGQALGAARSSSSRSRLRVAATDHEDHLVGHPVLACEPAEAPLERVGPAPGRYQRRRSSSMRVLIVMPSPSSVAARRSLCDSSMQRGTRSRHRVESWCSWRTGRWFRNS